MRRSGEHFQDLRDLVRFIAGFWGLLAVASITFAWLNDLFTFIPRHPTLAGIATVLAVLAAGFAFLYAFVEGEEEGAYSDDPTGYRRMAPAPNRPTVRSAFGRFAWAALSLALYLSLIALHGTVAGNREAGPSVIAAALIPALLICYGAIFGFLTAALTSLSVVHRLAARRNRILERAWPRLEETAPGREPSATDSTESRPASEFRIDQAH